MPGTLHVIPYAEADAARNMAVDEFLLTRPAGTFLRLYGWDPPAVSIGFGQRAERELDTGRLERDGIGLVRRMTGGRAILHEREATYSIAGDVGGSFGPTLHTAFAAIGAALKRSLELLGVACELERGAPRDPRPRDTAAPPCFASAARSEIVVDGRKLIGSAQKRLRRRFLQHGSLPLARGRDLVDYLRLDEDGRERYRAGTRTRSCVLSDHLAPLPGGDSIEKAFAAGFSDSLGMKVEPFRPSGDAAAGIDRLSAKYASRGWTAGAR